MLGKSFTKIASGALIAVSLFASAASPANAVPELPATQQTVSLKSEWDAAARGMYVLVRRRRETEDWQAEQNDQAKIWNKFIEHLLDREVYVNEVYRDSLGKLTVGVGHLVVKKDNLQMGDRISDTRVRELLEQDAAKAFAAAKEQATELGVRDSNFLIALGAVNFQLGAGWREKSPNTWEHLKNGNYEQAIRNVEKSLWAKQTPVRTKDFTTAIRKLMGEEQAVLVAAVDPSALSYFTQSPALQHG